MADDLDRLGEHVVGRVCVVGVGNRLAGDDGAGSAVAEALGGRAAGCVIDAGIAPENHLEPIVRGEPDTVLLVDAVELGAEPGSVRVLDPRALRAGGLSTHAASLGMVCDYLSARCAARVVLIGIQPGQLRLGAALSDAVTRSVEAVAGRLAELMGPGQRVGAGADASRAARTVEELR
jgi:hydrogenase 3 maturation protease